MELNGFDHFLFFVVCIFLPGLSLMSAKTPDVGVEPVLPAKKHIYFTNGLMLWIGALLVITNWNLSDRSWELLGIKSPILSQQVLIMCGLLIIIYIGDSIYNVFDKEEKKEEALMEKVLPENWVEYGQFVFLAVSAGVCEEFVYRGFLVNYFLEITKGFSVGPYIAIIIPAAVFSVSHMYQGWFNVFKILSLALLFCGIFLYSQSLLLVVIIHVCVDLLSGALVVIMSKREQRLQNKDYE